MNSYCSASGFLAGASWAKAVGLAAVGLAMGLAGCSRPPEHSGVPAMSAVAITPAGAEAAGDRTKAREAEVTVSAKVPAGRPAGTVPHPALEATASSAAAPVAGPLPAAARPERDRAVTRIQAGRVLDESGQPLVGATVLLRGTTHGTSTDATGGYMLEVPRGENTFVVGYAGYENETASSRDGQPLTVTLLPVPATSPAPPAKSPRGRR